MARARERSLALFGFALLVGCGGKSDRQGNSDSPEVDRNSAQSQVPGELQKPQASRYFLVRDDVRGPELVRFDAPESPQVIALGAPMGAYTSQRSQWSPNGQRLACALNATRADITPPNRIALLDAATDFEPRFIEQPNPADATQELAWVGDRALVAVIGSFVGAPDALHLEARYAWIDGASGAVSDLGALPLPSSKPSASRSGLLYVDGNCDLLYLERPGHEQKLLHDCRAEAEWSGDGSFALVTSGSERALYRLHDGQLAQAAAISEAIAPFRTATWRWAASAPRFVLSEKGEEQGSALTRLSYGDAETGQLVPFSELPRVHDATFVTDDLLVLSERSGERYALHVSRLEPGTTPEPQPLGLAERSAGLVASSDSSRLYALQDPLLELQLERGTPSAREELFDETQPVDHVLFRLLGSDSTGFLSMVEPTQGEAGYMYEPTHQYLLGLGEARAVIPLTSFDHAMGTHAQGVRTFLSAPQFGGIFYLSTSEHGYAVDWLGFDAIDRKFRLTEFQSSAIGIDFPANVTPP